jgi:hypothetical protein
MQLKKGTSWVETVPAEVFNWRDVAGSGKPPEPKEQRTVNKLDGNGR